jgi:hypothetical protein
MEQVIEYLGRAVGRIKGTTYITQRRPEHFFIKFQGFGLSAGLLRRLKDRHIVEVIILYSRKDGTQVAYKSLLTDFYDRGEHWTDREADRQLILPVRHMSQL